MPAGTKVGSVSRTRYEEIERILNPPRHPRTGKFEWTGDAAKRLVGWRVETPRSVQEKVEAVYD
ncbi:DUF6192 family protein [Nonomuraea muscovyensis]|uniref:DUF6192 family protein n=1 Tax=Nonomuraea muscovyensis TaxID=1124761 RepID=UPI0033DC4DA3